jgi:DNA-binding response OmpR family regulator
MNSLALLLIVDDELSLAESLGMVFETKGYEVLVAGTAEEGLEILKHRTPDVVLMDGNLPGVSGAVATKKMRASDYSGVIIGISAEDRSLEMERAGVDAFLGKPLEISELLSLVEKLVASKYPVS